MVLYYFVKVISGYVSEGTLFSYFNIYLLPKTASTTSEANTSCQVEKWGCRDSNVPIYFR